MIIVEHKDVKITIENPNQQLIAISTVSVNVLIT
jgi:hypothetical protein